MQNTNNMRLIIENYIKLRTKNPHHRFSRDEIRKINLAFDEIDNYSYNKNHSILFYGVSPDVMFENKPSSDNAAIRLWNLIMGSSYYVDRVEDFKRVASECIDYYDISYPNGDGMSESDAIRFATAHSASSFLGIQNPAKSMFSYNSMVKTLDAHSAAKIKYKPWLIGNLYDAQMAIKNNPDIMHRELGDVCLNAKLSSASMEGYSDYREYVFSTELDDMVLYLIYDIRYEIVVGFRIDRRGKYRLICSFPAPFRVVDFMVNNGSYDLCSHGGIYSRHTTEGYNSTMMWAELSRMARRDGYSLVCIDYAGYDTQISQYEYMSLSRMLNDHRLNDNDFRHYFDPYMTYMMQPKPLVMKGHKGSEMLMPYYRTLASGLHGTHSFENLIGISTNRELINIGVDIKNFWTNGDDQNTLVKNEHVESMIDFLNNYFDISWDKSLVGHKLGVWGKLWFSEDVDPIVEIGTFRSIWEKEGGDSNLVESSKFMSNYGKILQTLMLLMRLGLSSRVIQEWAIFLSEQCDPSIYIDRIPVRLQNVRNVKSGSYKHNVEPRGLLSQKTYLMSKTNDLALLGVYNYYDLLKSMYMNRSHFITDVDGTEYFPKNTIFRIEGGFNYAQNPNKDVPYILSDLYRQPNLTTEQILVQDILRSTKSYEGVISETYYFDDMMSLSNALIARNKRAWNHVRMSSQMISD